jgi:hypothetical protein
VEEYGVARQATDDKTISCMHFTCWITQAAETHSEFAIIIASSRQQNVPQCYVNCTLSFLFRHKCSASSFTF